MWHLPPLRQIYFSVFEICLLFARRKFVSSVGFDQIYGRSYKLQHHLGQKRIVFVNCTRYNRPFLDTLALVTILYYITLPSLTIDIPLHTRKYPKLLHVGVFPLHPPLGKHLLTAGPAIAYPGLQRYLTYSPAQWFLLRLITRTALSSSPGSPQSRKTANKKRSKKQTNKQ